MNKKILFVDDNVMQLNLMKIYFEKKLNSQIEICNKPEELLGNDFQQYDLIVTDMMMPNIDGMDILAAIRNKHRDVPVIMLTAHSSINLVIKFMQAGGTDYLEKPIDLELLSLKIKKALTDSTIKKNFKNAEISNLLKSESYLFKQEIILSVLNDIFNPLNSIISFSKKGINKFSQINDETKLNYFNIILNGSESMLEKLRLLATSSDQRKSNIVTLQETDILNLLERVQKELSFLIDNKIDLIPFENFMVHSNIDKLTFVIKYLIMHIHLFSGSNKEISITANKDFNRCIKIT